MSSPVLVPVDTTLGFYSERVALDGISYILSFRYNARMDRWLLDVADSSGNPILYGCPILESWPVLSRFRGKIPGLPQGPLVALDQSGTGQDPTEKTLGASVPLFYVGA